MNCKSLLYAAVLVGTTLTSCKKDDFVEKSELENYVTKTDGSSFKGTLAGTRNDGTAYTLPFDYKFKSGEDYDYVEAYKSEGDVMLNIGAYRYKISTQGNSEGSPSSDYLYVSGTINFTKKTFTYFNDIDGQFSQDLGNDKLFMYRFDYDQEDNGTYNLSEIQYDENTELLKAKLTLDMPEGNDLGYENSRATKITGEIMIKVPKNLFKTYTIVNVAPGTAPVQ